MSTTKHLGLAGTAAGVAGLAALLGACGGSAAPQDGERAAAPAATPVIRAATPADRPHYAMHADHPTFEGVDQLRGAADTVVVGEVKRLTVVEGTSPGVDAAGDPLPAVPQTEWTIGVERTVKGSASDEVVVSVTGGSTPAADFELDGVPKLAVGDKGMFFLGRTGDGAAFPLAGGSAVATPRADGTYALPADVTGGEALVATRDAEPVQTGGGGAPGGGSGGGSGGGGTAGGGGGAGGAGGGGAPVTPKDTTKPGVTVKLVARQTPKTVLAKGLRLSVTCTEACSLAGVLALDGRTAKRVKLATSARKAVPVGSGKATAGAGKAKVVTVKLTAKARKRLKGRTTLKLPLALTATDAAGNGTAVRRTVALKRTKVALGR